MKYYHTIIIGAGVAGVAAGCRLLENNIKNIVILEAKDRIGGRIHSLEVDGSYLDLGGQWCHGQENNIVYALAKDLNLLSSSINSYNDYTLYSPTLALEKNIIDELLEIASNIEDDEDGLKNSNDSFGTYFTNRYDLETKEKFKHDQNKLIIAKVVCDWYHKLMTCLNACPTWFDISAKGLTHYEICNGDYYLHFRNKGYKTILDVLMKKIPNYSEKLQLEDRMLLNKMVTSIIWSNPDCVLVHCLDGSSYQAKRVLITVSLGVLKKVPIFVPELPQYKVRAIEGLGFGTVNKVFLKFSDCWWHDDPKGVSILWSNQDKEYIAKKLTCNSLKENDKTWWENIFGFYPIDSHSNILLVWIVGEHAGSVEELSDYDIIRTLMTILQYFVGHKYQILKPLSILRSNWFSDPHCYGSYSYRSNLSERLNVFASDLAKPVYFNNKPVLFFAGEATSDHQYSTVHGAISSGFREANKIIDYSKTMEKKCKL